MSEQSWGPAKHYKAVHIDLDAVEALCAAATPGPWSATLGVSEYFGTEMSVYSEATELLVFSHIGCSATSADMEFAAAARTLVPQLVARVRELEALASTYRDLAKANHTEADAMTSWLEEARLKLEAGPDDAALDRVIMTLADRVDGDGEFDATYTELRAAIRAALKGE